MKLWIWALLLLCSCSPSSSLDFQHEGEARCRQLTQELQKIENREQLVQAESRLKQHFENLVDLMISAKEFQRDHLDDVSQDSVYEESVIETALQEQLRRIYDIEGGREIIERSQQEALVRLDAYERSIAKKNEKLKVTRK
jgi:hypothetical protein